MAMKKSLPLFSLITVYLTQVITMCNLYMFFMSTENYNFQSIELWPWVLLSLVTFIILHLFLRTPRPLPQVIILTVVCFLISIVIMAMFFIHVVGFFAWFFAIGFIAFTFGLALNLNLQDADTLTVLRWCELPVMGIVLLLWLSVSPLYYFPPYYLGLAVVMLILNFIALTMTRMNNTSYKNRGDRISAISAVSLCLVSLGALACGFVYFASSFASKTVATTSSAISWITGLISSTISAFFAWFVSLFPEAEEYASEIDYTATEEMLGASEGISLPTSDDMTAVLILGTILAVCLLVFVVFKLRKSKLSVGKIKLGYKRPQQTSEKVSFLKKFKEFLHRIYSNLRFKITVFLKRNTPCGAVIMLAKIGRLHGVSKNVGESYHSYLLRLAPLVDDSAKLPLETLAAIIDSSLYAPQKLDKKLSHKDYKIMRHAVARIRKKA